MTSSLGYSFKSSHQTLDLYRDDAALLLPCFVPGQVPGTLHIYNEVYRGRISSLRL
jgi:hypothetical protein